MNKRNTEGFALAYVVVVITVLCTLSIGLMSISLRVLQVQEKNMQRMQDKYEAQGEVELFVAELLRDLSNVESEEADEENGISAELFESIDAAYPAVQSALNNCLNDYFDESLDIQDATDSDEKPYKYTFIFDYVATVVRDDETTVSVETILQADCEIEYSESTSTPEGMTEPVTKYGYYITDASLEFVSYEIVTEGGDS